MNLTDTQKEQLLRPINGLRVSKDGKGFSHLEAYEVRAHLSRIFGIGGWSQEVVEQAVVFESSTDADKPRWTVCYRSLVRLTIPGDYDGVVYTEGATGDATNMPSRADAHDMALKTSQSQALKRCAMNLGDQFGLSLYNKGSLRPLVVRCLPWDDGTGDATEHITTALAPENGESETPQREVSSPSAHPAPTPGVGAEAPAPPAADTDDLTLIVAQLNAVVLMDPEQGMQTVADLMTQSSRLGLNNRPIPDDPKGRTLGAKLQAALVYTATEKDKLARVGS